MAILRLTILNISILEINPIYDLITLTEFFLNRDFPDSLELLVFAIGSDEDNLSETDEFIEFSFDDRLSGFIFDSMSAWNTVFLVSKNHMMEIFLAEKWFSYGFCHFRQL